MVDAGIISFVNHGCNGTYNVGVPFNETETTIPLGHGIPAILAKEEASVFHPFNERHFDSKGWEDDVALRTIEAGEEILDNYLVFGGTGDVEEWELNLEELKVLCSGGVGVVSEYEDEE